MTQEQQLANLEYIPYINQHGELPDILQGKIGAYAIFDGEKILQFIGYSRDIYASLKQHLVRQPELCYWVKAQTIERPSRAVLEQIEQSWINENGVRPIGNGENQQIWTQPIDVQPLFTSEERADYDNPMNDEMTKIKTIKNVARRVEAEILQVLEQRGLNMQIRFNPKLKESGLLDLK
ncbi:MAG: GIY-YIG nuclease family protein [Richelia sp.]|nr:GIY-YIG nuclease family protein [Richelia sp.]CDN16744.1 hypothetical protein RintRC_5922 [Richelia intracellularis]